MFKGLKLKKILVTGADGFIGSHMVERLVLNDFPVKALTQYNSFNSWGWLENLPSQIINELEIVPGDIRDSFFVNNLVKDCSHVIHLAALIAIPYSYKSTLSYIETNIIGTHNLLQSCKLFGIERFLHTSTSEVYGTAKYVPIDEKHPLSGQSPYSASKIGADQLAFSFYSSFELPVVIVRPFNTFGPRQSARAFIPTVITQCLEGFDTIKLGSLKPTRDFSYVSDTTAGFLKILKSDKGAGSTFNLGSGFEISMQQTAERIIQLINPDIKIMIDKERIRPVNSEVDRLLACNKLAIETFGWKPEFASIEGFDKALKETINWFSNHSNKKFYKSYLYNE